MPLFSQIVVLARRWWSANWTVVIVSVYIPKREVWGRWYIHFGAGRLPLHPYIFESLSWPTEEVPPALALNHE